MIKESPRRYVGGELTARIQRSQSHSPRFQGRNREGGEFHIICFRQVAKVTIDVWRAKEEGLATLAGLQGGEVTAGKRVF